MKQIENRLPLWKAPDTLLYRVIKEIDNESCALGFFSWAVVYRYVFCIATLAIAGVSCLIVYGVDTGWDVFLFVNLLTTQVITWYEYFLKIHSICYDLVIRFIKYPGVLLSALVFAVMIIIAWTGSITALYQLLPVQQRRKYI